MKKAHELELDYLDTLVKTTKPLAAMAKLKEGFVLFECNEKFGGFMLKKELKTTPSQLSDEEVEVSFDQTSEIGRMIDDDYVGVQMRSNGETDESHPEKWSLILKKKV